MADHLATAQQLGTDLRRLIDLAADPSDPDALLLGAELEQMSADDAAALLFVAVLTICRYEGTV